MFFCTMIPQLGIIPRPTSVTPAFIERHTTPIGSHPFISSTAQIGNDRRASPVRTLTFWYHSDGRSQPQSSQMHSGEGELFTQTGVVNVPPVTTRGFGRTKTASPTTTRNAMPNSIPRPASSRFDMRSLPKTPRAYEDPLLRIGQSNSPNRREFARIGDNFS